MLTAVHWLIEAHLPFPVLRLATRSHPAGRHDERAISAVGAKHQGFAVRARNRFEPSDHKLPVESRWPDGRERGTVTLYRRDAGFSKLALAL